MKKEEQTQQNHRNQIFKAKTILPEDKTEIKTTTTTTKKEKRKKGGNEKYPFEE